MALDPVTVFVAVAMMFILVPALVGGYVLARFLGLFAQVSMFTRPLGVGRWAALGPTLVFLAGFGWLSASGALPANGEEMSTPVSLALIAFGAGLFGVSVALGNVGRYRRLRAGAVASGVAESDGGEAVAPLSGEPCLAWAVRIREHTGPIRRGARAPVHRASGGVRFVVRTETERVRVDPSEATLDVWSFPALSAVDYTVSERDDVPDRVHEYAADRGLRDPDRSRIYEEHRIEAGSRVTALGTADGESALGDGAVLTDDSADDLRRRIGRRIRAGPAGAVLALVSFGAALVLTGVV